MVTHAAPAKKERINNIIAQIKAFQFCSPADESEAVTAVTSGFRHSLTQLKRLACPILPERVRSRLNAIDVDIDDIYSAFDAHSEVSAILLDIESAVHGIPEDPIALPAAVCSVVGRVLGSFIYSHRRLEGLFSQAGAVGEVPEGNCVVKCQSWLRRMHNEVPDPAAVLGKVLEEFMEVDSSFQPDGQREERQKIVEVLGRSGLSYHTGGFILGAASALPTKSLKQILKDCDLAGVDKEFERALANIDKDPPAAITAACSILESLFKVYIEDNEGIEMPSDQSLKPLWKVASKHLGLDPSVIEDNDVKKILSGMNSIVDGIGSLRTHTSSAHGHGRRPYRLQARHARLAVSASHTLVGFFIETWDQRKRKATL